MTLEKHPAIGRRAKALRATELRRLARIVIGTISRGAIKFADWIEMARSVRGVRV